MQLPVARGGTPRALSAAHANTKALSEVAVRSLADRGSILEHVSGRGRLLAGTPGFWILEVCAMEPWARVRHDRE